MKAYYDITGTRGVKHSLATAEEAADNRATDAAHSTGLKPIQLLATSIDAAEKSAKASWHGDRDGNWDNCTDPPA